MKKYLGIMGTALLFSCAACVCEEKANAPKQEMEIDIAKISESFGHMIGKNLSTLEVALDPEYLAKGIKDFHAGKEPPLSESECIESLTAIQERAHKKRADENLVASNAFLAENAKKKNVVSLEDGKLQYKIEKEGAGEVVQEHNTALIRYTGKHLDGTVFGASQEDDQICLDEVIPGFAKGLVGMKEGEKRVIYIHPDLGYGTSGFFPPNSLLTFEIELVKAQVADDSASLELAEVSTQTQENLQ